MTALTDRDFSDAAALLGCEVAAIRAVCQIEAPRGGFNADGTPVTLFEGHIFHRQTGGRFDADHPDISYPTWTKAHYGKTWQAEQDRLARAIALDRDAALKSASWGRFQIMGFNFDAAGFESLDGFITAMHTGEREHLLAFCAFVQRNKLDAALRAHDWAAFARGYNGAGYAANQYDTKLAAAYAKFANDTPLVQLGQAGSYANPDLYVTPKGTEMAPFLALALPALFDAVPKLIKAFTSDGTTVPERNVAAVQIAVEAAKQAVGAANEQALVEELKTNPEAAAKVRAAIDASWATITDASGVPDARKADAAIVASGEGFWKSPSFWIAMSLMPLVYMIGGAVTGLWGQPFSDDVRSAIANGIVGLVIGGLSGYYFGQTTSRNRTPAPPQ